MLPNVVMQLVVEHGTSDKSEQLHKADQNSDSETMCVHITLVTLHRAQDYLKSGQVHFMNKGHITE